MLDALLFLPAFLAIAFVLHRTRRRPAPRVLAAAAPAPPELPGELAVAALDALLAELEQTTVRIDGADELVDDAVARLGRLAERLEAAAASLVGVG